jgi:hypothetical protein
MDPNDKKKCGSSTTTLYQSVLGRYKLRLISTVKFSKYKSWTNALCGEGWI